MTILAGSADWAWLVSLQPVKAQHVACVLQLMGLPQGLAVATGIGIYVAVHDLS